MSIIVYWLEPEEGPCGKPFGSTELSSVQKFVEEQRKAGFRHVTISAEMDGQVGKPGVDSVKDGKTPDGHVYDWSKAGRAGKMKRKDLVTPVTK